MNDVELLDNLRAAMHELQLARYRAESIRQEYDEANAKALKCAQVVEELDNTLRCSLDESGPYYFDRQQSKMVYRG